jgi:hypothetical protein
LKKVLFLKISWAIIIYAILDGICVGLGMGIPFFCILLGLPVGWYLARRFLLQTNEPRVLLKKIIYWSAITATFTILLMLVIWMPSIKMLFAPAVIENLANYGIPMILYEPLPSYIGWMALMILISPSMQFLLSIFCAILTWLVKLSRIPKQT